MGRRGSVQSGGLCSRLCVTTIEPSPGHRRSKRASGGSSCNVSSFSNAFWMCVCLWGLVCLQGAARPKLVRASLLSGSSTLVADYSVACLSPPVVVPVLLQSTGAPSELKPVADSAAGGGAGVAPAQVPQDMVASSRGTSSSMSGGGVGTQQPVGGDPQFAAAPPAPLSANGALTGSAGLEGSRR